MLRTLIGCAAATALVGGLAVQLGSAAAVPGATDPIAFADQGPLVLAPGGESTVVLVVNQTANPRHVTVSLSAAAKPLTSVGSVPIVVITPPIMGVNRSVAADIPVVGALRITLAPKTVGEVYLVVTDQADDVTIRRTVKVALPTIGEPAVTSWKHTISVGPGREGNRIGTIPLAPGEPCGTTTSSEPLKTVLLSGNDTLAVTATCDGGILTLSADKLNDVPVGVYGGALKVGETDVSLELTKRAPPWEAILALLAGIVIALILRSLNGRRAIWVLRGNIQKLTAPSVPSATGLSNEQLKGHLEAWRDRASDEVDHTKRTLVDMCSDERLWPVWQRGGWRLLRCLFVPSANAKKRIADTETARGSAEQGIQAWKDDAAARLTALHDLAAAPSLPMTKLAGRACDIVSDPEKGLTAPSDSAAKPPNKRQGVDGLKAVLDEAAAIASVDEISQRVTVMLSHLPDAAPPEPAEDRRVNSVIARAWRVSRAEAQLRLTAATEEVARAVDAPALMKDGLETRVHAASLIVDRLAVPAPPKEELLRVETIAQGLEEASTAWWQWMPAHLRGIGAEIGHAAAGRAVVISDMLAVGIAAIVVLAAGMAALYKGNAWGGTADVLTAVLAAAGGTLALAPLFAAIDSLGTGTDAPVATPDDRAGS